MSMHFFRRLFPANQPDDRKGAMMGDSTVTGQPGAEMMAMNGNMSFMNMDCGNGGEKVPAMSGNMMNSMQMPIKDFAGMNMGNIEGTMMNDEMSRHDGRDGFLMKGVQKCEMMMTMVINKMRMIFRSPSG